MKGLSEEDTDPDPFVQFEKWFNKRMTAGIDIPNSVSLATASANGYVTLRTVLLKDFDRNGFVFFTNYNSKKSIQLLLNPRVALLFYWAESGQQIRIEGTAHQVSEKESEAYFRTRPRESQLSAWASEQSAVIPDRQYLEKRFEYYQNQYKNKTVERPLKWGGFRIVPEWFEFWQNGEYRLHDRLAYKKTDNSWVIERLAP